MKKRLAYCKLTLIIFLLNIGVSICYADPVDSILAKTVATNFYNSKSNLTATKLTLAYTEKSDDNIPVYYVFNVNGKDGFVIVSGDDAAMPILGYSFEGKYEAKNISPELAFWMGGYKTQINSIRKKDIKPTINIKQEWNLNRNNSPANTSSNSSAVNCPSPIIVCPLLGQIKWNQRGKTYGYTLYNDLCPDTLPNQRPTGCAATAMGQIMKFWSYPAHGIGTTPAYTTSQSPSYNIPSTNLSAATYDWSNIPDSLTINSSPNEKSEVAKLLYHCGISVMMDYGPISIAYDISLKKVPSIESSMPYYFGYSASTIEGITKYSHLNNWNSILKNELDNGRPVIYTGTNSHGGHTWICDGYADGNAFHMNWGWGGDNNGFYNINLLNPEADEYEFLTQTLVIGIQPDCKIADLTVIDKSINNINPTPGSTVIASCKEKNNGHLAAGTNSLKLYLCNSSTFNLSNSEYLGQISISSVAAQNQTVLLNTQVTIPSTTTSGQYWLFFYADANGQVSECYEDNNFTSIALNISSPTCSPPTNDGCNGNFSATQLNFSQACTYLPSTSCGATSSGFGACDGNADDDVFFRFTPTSSNATIKVASTTGYDAVFQLLKGPCGNTMQPLDPGCINNTGNGGIETQSYTGLVSGNTYFIRVWHAGLNWGSGNFSICVYGNSCSTPGISTPLTPGNPSIPGQIINTSTPQFNWTLASGATKYIVRVSKEPYGYNNIVYTSACVIPQLTIPNGILQNGNNYRWDVQALFACGSNCSSYSNNFYFTVSTVACTAPFTQATDITFPVISSNQLSLGWTNGDGNRRIVKINTTNSFTPPVNGTGTNPNSTYSGSGEQVVYDGSAGYAVVYGLSPSTNYCFRVYEANCSGSLSFYNTSTGNNNPICQSTSSGACTIPTMQASNLSFFNVGTNSIGLNWSVGNGNKRIVKINTANTFAAPVNGTDPTANSIYSGSGEQVVYNGTGNSITISGLAIGTNYCFKVYEANCSGAQILYNVNTATNNPNCQSTSSSCGTLQTPLPLVGNTTCPGVGFYNSSVLLHWSVTNSGRYDIEIRQYPYGPANIVFSQYCISDTTRFINNASLSAGKLYSWRVRSTADCNNCISSWSQPYYFHMAPDITPNGNLNICNNTGITLTTPIISPPSPATVAYQWFKVNTGSSDIPVGTNTNSYFVSTSGIYYVKLIYNGTTICPGNDTTYTSQYDSINIGYIPAAPSLISNSPVFQGTNLLLSATSGESGNIDYFWTGPNGFASNSQNPTIASVGTNAAGTYSCYLIKNGCISDIATTQVFITLPNHTTYKYWFDDLYNNPIIADMGTSNNLNLQQSVSTNQLNEGLHVFYINFMGSDGRWSSIISSFLYKIPITAIGTPKYQYWFDNNSQDSVTVVVGNTSNFLLLDSLINTLPIGLHTLNVRFKPDGKLWSSITSSFFYKNPATNNNNSIARCAYWYDNNWQNPNIVFYSGYQNLSAIINTDVDSLSIGMHKVSMMFRDDNGSWSSVVSDSFNRGAITTPACPINNKQFISRVYLSNTAIKQWQVDTGSGFTNLQNNSVYSGVNADTLQLTNASTSWYGYKYRCVVTDGSSSVNSEVFTLRFSQIWKGTSDAAWENLANWNCNTLPDVNTDVIIMAGSANLPVVNTSGTCRSLITKTGVNIVVKTGATFVLGQ